MCAGWRLIPFALLFKEAQPKLCAGWRLIPFALLFKEAQPKVCAGWRLIPFALLFKEAQPICTVKVIFLRSYFIRFWIRSSKLSIKVLKEAFSNVAGLFSCPG